MIGKSRRTGVSDNKPAASGQAQNAAAARVGLESRHPAAALRVVREVWQG